MAVLRRIEFDPIFVLRIQLLSEEACGCLDQLGFDLPGDSFFAVPAQERDHASRNVALGNDGHKTADGEVRAVGHRNGIVFVADIKLAGLNDFLHLVVQLPLQHFLFGNAGAGNDHISVADGYCQTAGFVEGFCVLGGKLCHLPDGGVFLEDYLALAVGENLQGVALADSHCSSYFFGDNYTTEVVPLCQVGAKKFNGFFKKLVVTRV